MTGHLIPFKGEFHVAHDTKVKDLMIPLEDYPHIPYWCSLRQAMAMLQEASVKFGNSFEPRALLVFDEKYQLKGILTLRDIIKGLEPKFLHETSLIKSYPNLSLLMKGFRRASLQGAAKQQVSEMMSPIKLTVDGDAHIPQALFLMVKENVGLMPVISDNKVTGMIRLSDLYKEISKIILGD